MMVTSIWKIWFYVLMVLHQTTESAGKFLTVFTSWTCVIFDEKENKHCFVKIGFIRMSIVIYNHQIKL
jgi:hypothetical protein